VGAGYLPQQLDNHVTETNINEITIEYTKVKTSWDFNIINRDII
jgi:hypothetical protein